VASAKPVATLEIFRPAGGNLPMTAAKKKAEIGPTSGGEGISKPHCGVLCRVMTSMAPIKNELATISGGKHHGRAGAASRAASTAGAAHDINADVRLALAVKSGRRHRPKRQRKEPEKPAMMISNMVIE